jgi:DNA processing protein
MHSDVVAENTVGQAVPDNHPGVHVDSDSATSDTAPANPHSPAQTATASSPRCELSPDIAAGVTANLPGSELPPDITAELRLALVDGVGPRLRQLLLDRFGTAAAIFSASLHELREIPGIGPKTARNIAAAAEEIDPEQLAANCAAAGIDIVLRSSPTYPRPLQDIPDPPGVLFVRGRLAPQDALAIAIVGSRHASHYGLSQAERLAAALARAGLTIISGLARGIDAAAHRGALAAGGRTIAVLGSGVLNIYPPEHAALADEVAAAGALVSENAPAAEPFSGAFPQRNRLISGMSLGVLVVEASTKSGALITARHANEQGREVFAVPGRIDSRTSQGCHRLIRDGAKLVESVDDVLEELGPLVAAAPSPTGMPIHHPAELVLNDLEKQVLTAITDDATLIDQVISVTRLPPPQVLSTLSVLEMRRLIRRPSGTTVARI